MDNITHNTEEEYNCTLQEKCELPLEFRQLYDFRKKIYDLENYYDSGDDYYDLDR